MSIYTSIDKLLQKRRQHSQSPINKSPSNLQNPKTQNETGTLLLTSIFNLPHISPHQKHSRSNSSINDLPNQSNLNTSKTCNSIIINPLSHRSVLLNNLSSLDETLQPKKQKRQNQLDKVENIFKERFYDDIENNIKYKFRRQLMFEDPLLKERVIHMKKVVGFWKCLCDYTGPKFALQKFGKFHHDLKLKQKKKLNSNMSSIYPYLNNTAINESKPEIKPLLFTNSLMHQLRTKKKREFRSMFNINNIN